MANSLSQITVRLNLDNNKFRADVTGSSEALARFNRVVKQYSPSVERAEDHTRGFGLRLRDTVITLGLARHALLNLDALLLSLPRSIIRTNAEFEKMGALMRGLSQETDSYAQILKRAEDDEAFVIDMALNTPFDINSIMDSFAKFRSAGIDPTTGSIQSLIDSVAKFGGTSQELKRATIAIQQMAGKGTISLEELRQQLGEVIPDAIQVMARGVGRSVGELVAEISKGTVAATEGLQALFRQMAIENSGAALEMTQTWDGTMSRLRTRFALFQKEIGDAGLFDELKNQLVLITDSTLGSPEALQFAQDLGRALTVMVQGFTTVAQAAIQYRHVIVGVTAALVAWSIARRTLIAREALLSAAIAAKNQVLIRASAIQNAYTNYVRVGTAAVGTYSGAINLQTGALIRAQGAMAGLTVATAGAGAALSRFGVAAKAALGGWLGIVTIAVVGLSYAIISLKDDFIETAKEIAETGNISFVTDEQLEDIRKTIELFKELEERAKNQEVANSMIGYINTAENQLKRLRHELGMSKDEFIEYEKAIANANFKRSLDTIKQVLKINIGRELLGDINAYKKQLDEIIQNEDYSIEKRKEMQRDLNKQLKGIIEKQFDDRLRIARENHKKLEEEGKENDSLEISRAIKTIEAIKQLREDFLKRFELPEGGMEENTKNAEVAANRFQKFMDRQNDTLAKYNARLKESNDLLAVFTSQRKRGDFGELSDTQIKDAEALIEEVYKQKKAFELVKEEAKKYDIVLNKIAQTASSINRTFATRSNKNQFLKDTIRAEGYRAKLEELKEQLSALSTKSNEAAVEIKEINEVLADLDNKAVDSTIKFLQEQTKEINNKLLPANEKINAEYQQTIRNLSEMVQLNRELFSDEQIEAVNEYVNALNAERLRELEKPIQSLAREWSQTTKAMDQIWADTITSFIDTLADGIVEGQFQFDQFLSSFAKMLVKMQLQAAAAGIISSIFGANTGVQPSGQTGAPLGGETATANYAANGGVMTSQGMLQLQKYADGGIAYRPQVAVFGEGSQPEAYVPLPDGRTIPVTMNAPANQQRMEAPDVNVNVINESGIALDAKQKGVKFNGRQMILDVVVDAASRPGKFRDSLKGAMK